MKKFLIISISILLMMSCACSNHDKLAEVNLNSEEHSSFCNMKVVETGDTYYVLCDINTKVLYYGYSDNYSKYSLKGITPIYNADGSLKLYEGEIVNDLR